MKSFYLPIFLLLFPIDHAEAEIYRCFNTSGKEIYTDNKSKCSNHEGMNSENVETIDVKIQNIHSQYGAVVSEEYYNYAFRDYISIDGYSIPIIAEKKLANESPKTLTKAAEKLSSTLEKACRIFTKSICIQFSPIQYFLFTGNESRTGGRHGGQWYFPKNNPTSKKFDNSIVVRSASDYLTYSDDTALMFAIHELSHAYYYLHYQRLYKKNMAAYQNAITKNLYTNVKNEWGSITKKGYAVLNEREYFAELAKIYWLRNNYYPFNRKELREHDPEGYMMISQAFILE